MAAHYYAVSWDQLHRDARALAWRLMDKGPYRRHRRDHPRRPDPGGDHRARAGRPAGGERVHRQLRGRQWRHADRGGEGCCARGDQAADCGGRWHRVPDRGRPCGYRHDGTRGAWPATEGAFRRGLCEARRPRGGGRFHHRGIAGHLDPVSRGTPSRSSLRPWRSGADRHDFTKVLPLPSREGARGWGAAAQRSIAQCPPTCTLPTSTARIGLAVPPRIFNGKLRGYERIIARAA